MISRIYLALNFAVIGLIAVAYLYDPNLLLSRYGLETGSIGMDNMLRPPLAECSWQYQHSFCWVS